VLGGKGADRVTIDESDDGGGRKRGKKRRRGVKINVKIEKGSRKTSKVWDVFDEVKVPDPYEKGKML